MKPRYRIYNFAVLGMLGPENRHVMGPPLPKETIVFYRWSVGSAGKIDTMRVEANEQGFPERVSVLGKTDTILWERGKICSPWTVAAVELAVRSLTAIRIKPNLNF